LEIYRVTKKSSKNVQKVINMEWIRLIYTRRGLKYRKDNRCYPWVGIDIIRCHMQVHPSRNYILVVISSPNYTSLPSIVAIILVTCLMVVLQPSGYSIFYSRDTPIQLGLLWWSYSCQYLNTETPSISYSRNSYIRLVVTL